MSEVMKPGMTLDALVATEVMGVDKESVAKYMHWLEDPVANIYPGDGYVTPEPYSTDIGSAFRVVEKMRKSDMGWSFNIDIAWDGSSDVHMMAGDCNCPYNKPYDPKDGHGLSLAESECESESLPHAICLAVLRAAGVIPKSEE